jgi:hypothetical protein
MEPRTILPERRVNLAWMLGVTLAACAGYALALSAHVLPPPGMAIVLFTTVPVCASVAAVVLVAQTGTDRDQSEGWVAAGLSVAVVAMVLQVISFPAVAANGGLLGTSDQASATLYLLFHIAFAAGAVAGALRMPPGWQLRGVLAGLVVVVAVAIDAVPLPVLLRNGAEFTPLLVGLELVLVLGTGVALALWVTRVRRPAPAPKGWVAVALSLSLYDVLLNGLGSERFSAVWWASLSFRVATYVVLAFGVLTALLVRSRRVAAHSESELDRRENQLRGSLGVASVLLSSAEDLARAIRSSEVGDVLSARAREAAGADYGSVVIGVDGQQLRLLGADGYDEVARARLRLTDWDLLLPAPYVVSMDMPIFLETATEIQAHFPGVAALPSAESCSLAALPIRIRGQTIGMLTLLSRAPRDWPDSQRRVLAGIAAQGGQAIGRARAYEQASDAARTLQESLLPSGLPSPHRLELAARYQPAVDTHLVGGDWYDCLLIDDHQVALIVGDVMGKGLRAAAQMGRIRIAVRSLAAVDPHPAAVLTSLDALNLELADDEIVTLVYILLDTTTGTARILRAGHPPPLLVTPDGTSSFIEVGASTPLGIPHGRREEASFQVPSGGVLVLYTDGLVEDRANGLGPGLDTLADCLVTPLACASTTSDLATHILEVSRSHAGQDDIAVLLARYI